MPTGLFRSEDGSVQVEYGTFGSIPIPRSRYEANGYKPDFDKLLSEAEYWAAERERERERRTMMPRGPKGEKRPADVIGNAVRVMRIATGEIDVTATTEDGKNAAAVALGRMGGKARAEGMSAKRRKEIARKAAASRWKKSAS